MAKVFISYSKRDYIGEGGKPVPGNVVDKIIGALERNGVEYWIDREALEPGATYAKVIAKSIKGCDIFLYLSTANANESEWTLREISLAIELKKTILPVRIDESEYDSAVALYLASVQYIDWQALGEKKAINKIITRICGGRKPASSRKVAPPKLWGFTRFGLVVGLFFLTGCYALLSYLFLKAGRLRSVEIMDGLAGYLCELGLLASIYYIIRMLRGRRCIFAMPALIVLVVFLGGMLLGGMDVIICAGLLLFGWLVLLFLSFLGGCRSLFSVMSKDQSLFHPSDPELLLLLYLVLKAVILVMAHYMGVNPIRW